jgi:hypothetical protein
MTANRIVKEARPLLLPWCAVALAGALPLVYPLDWTPLIYLLGFFVVPLLATLSLGNEFQYRTFSLLLSQPVDRMEIWGEKLSVTVVAVVSAVLVFSLALRATSFHPAPQTLAFVGAWILASIAAATFWTLIARSTVGGVALTLAVQFFIIIALNLAYWAHGTGYSSPTDTTVVRTVIFVLLSYASVMLWLGRRRLARFQAAGGMAGDDLLAAGPDVMPGAFAGWLRWRPTGAVLNLFRKEFCLLRPVWLISLLAAAGWACLTLFGLLHQRWSNSAPAFAVVSVGEISMLMIAILAGCLSLGEERTSGTHAWHLTLPAPALLQWRIKLYMALFAGFVGAGLPPLLIAGRSLGSPHAFMDAHLGAGWLLGVLVLTFASFWCVCAVKGTVRAGLWVLPVMIALSLVGELGGQAGHSLTDLFIARFDPFANLRFTYAVSNIRLFDRHATPMLIVLLVPTLLFAVIQSYRLFRAQLQDSTRSAVRNLLPLAMMAFLCSFSLLAFDAFVDHARQHMGALIHETDWAIAKIQSGTANLDATHPLQLTVEDLAKASPLSEHTRHWLRNSHITVALEEAPHHGRYGCGGNSRSIDTPYDKGYSWYLATIHLAGGSYFTLSFEAGHHFTISGGVCE